MVLILLGKVFKKIFESQTLQYIVKAFDLFSIYSHSTLVQICMVEFQERTFFFFIFP